jgi:hypothetical protein
LVASRVLLIFNGASHVLHDAALICVTLHV